MLVMDGRLPSFSSSSSSSLSTDAVDQFRPYWDYSRQPFARMQEHNRVGTFKAGPFKTKAGAPHNVLLAQFGPFHAHACVFARTMNNKTVAKMSTTQQIACACTLSAFWHLKVEKTHPPLRIFVDDMRMNVFTHALDSLNHANWLVVLQCAIRAMSSMLKRAGRAVLSEAHKDHSVSTSQASNE